LKGCNLQVWSFPNLAVEIVFWLASLSSKTLE
jgi:hypothetical protein